MNEQRGEYNFKTYFKKIYKYILEPTKDIQTVLSVKTVDTSFPKLRDNISSDGIYKLNYNEYWETSHMCTP